MKNKGITLVVLIITIIVMVILGGIIIGSVKDLSNSSRITKMFSVMQLVKARAETVIEEKIFNNEELEEYIFSNPKYIVNSEDEIIYISWGKEEIAHQGIDNSILSDEEYFVIAYNKTEMQVEDIIYTTGCNTKNGIVYKMSDLRKSI